MKKNLIPTPVVDKNGKLTTVHKKTAGASLGTDNLVSVPPVANTTLAPVREALTAAQVEEFLSLCSPTGRSKNPAGYVRDTEDTFRSLSGETQAVMKRLYDGGLLSYDTLMDKMIYFMNEFPGFGWIDGTPSRIAEPALRASAEIVELAVAHRPELLRDFGQAGLFSFAREVVMGCMDRAAQMGTKFDASSEEGMDAMLGTFSFVMRSESFRLQDSSYADERGKGHRSLRISSDKVARFVVEHPDLAGRAAVFMRERGLGDSEDEAQVMVDHFTETAEAPSISSGRL